MAFYLVQFAYTAEALATMAKNPQDRSTPVRELVQKSGGRLIGFYYCFGEYDGVALAEMPDDTTATALALAAVSPGHLKAYKTTKLFTVEETMEAMRKAASLTFRGPSTG
ncbi:MAG: GYD domain-containing protein [Chloroflexi bacterium]|nr:GYD domain-containing protein [Chloroflexota bacterium]